MFYIPPGFSQIIKINAYLKLEFMGHAKQKCGEKAAGWFTTFGPV